MTDREQDPRAQFRHLPDPVRPDELVETQDAGPRLVVETPPQMDQRLWLAGGAGTP
jgi:hypothetical protein